MLTCSKVTVQAEAGHEVRPLHPLRQVLREGCPSGVVYVARLVFCDGDETGQPEWHWYDRFEDCLYGLLPGDKRPLSIDALDLGQSLGRRLAEGEQIAVRYEGRG